jgi:hypothetical protein
VYHIAENETNLDRVIAALAANTDYPSNIDFALFDEAILGELGIKIGKSEGDSPDMQVNAWHSDLQELLASKLLELATAISGRARIERKGDKQVLNLVAKSIAISQIDRVRLKWKSDLDKLENLIADLESNLPE